MYDAARNLKVITTASTGTDHIDLQEAASRGIAVLSIKNDIEFLRGVTSTAEQALALMLSVIRMIPSSFDSVKQGRWQSASFRGHMLSGKTLGIIGFGRLGEIMAGYGNALKMKVLVADPYKIVHVNYVEQVSLEKLLERSDIFSLHVHLNDETRGMIGKNQINMMKDGAVIVNTSRGAIIDEMAMVEALESGKLGGAGLDVLATELYEDISKSPVVQYARKHDNVVPHRMSEG